MNRPRGGTRTPIGRLAVRQALTDPPHARKAPTMELMLENVNAVELLTAAGVLLNSYWLYRLNSKFDALTGRVSELSVAHNAHVNAPGLHGR